MMPKYFHRILPIVSFVIVTVFLTGCGPLAPLPDKERYQHINEVLKDLDYRTAGTIISEKKDRGDGVFSPSIVRVEYDAAQAFDILSERLNNVDYIGCRSKIEIQIWCDSGVVDIAVTRSSVDDSTTVLEVTDVNNGRSTQQ